MTQCWPSGVLTRRDFVVRLAAGMAPARRSLHQSVTADTAILALLWPLIAAIVAVSVWKPA